MLGGYENSLLGYRTSTYQDIASQGLLARMDMIMFGKSLYLDFIMTIMCCLFSLVGHLIYELATGVTLQHVPDKDYKFKEVKNQAIRDVLQFIFREKWKGTNFKTIEQVPSINKLTHIFIR